MSIKDRSTQFTANGQHLNDVLPPSLAITMFFCDVVLEMVYLGAGSRRSPCQQGSGSQTRGGGSHVRDGGAEIPRYPLNLTPCCGSHASEESKPIGRLLII